MPKTKKTKDRYTTVCPKCKSPDIRQDKSTLQQLGALPTMYICNKCGYSSYSFPEVNVSELDGFEEEVDKENLRDSRKKKSILLDPSYGNFQVRFVWKIGAPITIIIGLLTFPNEPFTGTFLISAGIVASYITYFKKRKLREE